MSFGLFFFHNPKAAGTAVGRVLSSMFPPDERCPLIENTEREHVARGGYYTAFRGYRFYGGHYGHDIFEQVANGHLAVTCFRDPADRLLSLYTYFRHHVAVPQDEAERDDLYPIAFSRDHDFYAFISSDDPRIELHTRNHHARQLTGSGWAADDAIDIDFALRLVDAMPWFYVCAHPNLSQAWGNQVFGPVFGTIAHENVTVVNGALEKPHTADYAARQIIVKKNKHDRALYVRAIRRLLR